MFSALKQLLKCRRARITSAIFRLRVVQRKSFTLGLSARVCRIIFIFFTEVLSRQQTPIPNISLTFQTAQKIPFVSMSIFEKPCFFLSDNSTSNPSISHATMICSDVVLEAGLFLTASNLFLLKDFLYTQYKMRRTIAEMMQYSVGVSQQGSWSDSIIFIIQNRSGQMRV